MVRVQVISPMVHPENVSRPRVFPFWRCKQFPATTDLLLRNVNTGGLVVYDISNNQLTGDAFIGTIGLEWQYAGIATVHATGASDLVLRNVNSGAFEVYDIAGNTLVGAASLGAV